MEGIKMPFSIIRNDITKMETDAIVNAANSRPLEGGGVCGAIFAAAGADELREACNEIGFCKTGDAVITKGFNLKAKYIIHTVGPVYGVNPKEEGRQLYSCYRKSLEIAKEKQLESIAFPLISSGIYGYPKEQAIEIATDAIRNFLLENDKNSFVINEKLFNIVKRHIENSCIESDVIKSTSFDTVNNSAQFTYDSIMANTSAEPDEKVIYPKAPMPSRANIGPFEIEETFSQMFLRLIDEKGMTDVEVYKRVNIDRKLFSKMRKIDYVPKKTTVMALIIALRLDMNEAEELLNRAGFAFSKAKKFDLIVEFFIEHEMYDIFEINETLFAFDEPLLGV